jgi:hypothetical protein
VITKEPRLKPALAALWLALAPALLVAACSGADADSCSHASGTVCVWVGTGEPGLNGDGLALRQSRLYWPLDLEFTPEGTAYVLDWNNHLVRRVTADGTLDTVVGDFVGDGAPGMADGEEPGVPGTEVNLNHPTDLQIGVDGLVYIAAWHNHKLRRLDPDTGDVVVIAGSTPGFAGDGGPARSAQFNQPKAIVFDREQRLYVLDQRNQRVRRIAADGGITTVVGTGTSGFAGDGGAPGQAELSFETGPNPEPSGALALDSQGRLYIADGLNHCIRRVDFEADSIETIAGTGADGYSGDGGDARAATFGEVRDLEFGPDGRLYFADTDHHVIRAIDLDSGILTTVVGTGRAAGDQDRSREGDDALHTALRRPMGIAFDPDGHLYIADTFDNRILKVWK